MIDSYAAPVWHSGRVDDGRFIPDEPIAFKENFRQFEGRRVRVAVNLPYKRNTAAQRGYYWEVVLGMLAERIGDCSRDDVHRDVKERLLKDMDGNVGRTRHMNTQQFAEFIDAVVRWAAEFHGLVIPDPNAAGF